jgi:quercetin dioxygenase-like cupin family protein
MVKTIEQRRARAAACGSGLSTFPAAGDNREVEPTFIRFDDVRSFALTDGVTGRPLFGERGMINLIDFEPGATVPLHSHPHEQLGIVLRGMQALVVDGVARELGPMEGYVLPGGVEHSAYCGPEGALVLDVFSPVREDYLERWRAEG